LADEGDRRHRQQDAGRDEGGEGNQEGPREVGDVYRTIPSVDLKPEFQAGHNR